MNQQPTASLRHTSQQHTAATATHPAPTSSPQSCRRHPPTRGHCLIATHCRRVSFKPPHVSIEYISGLNCHCIRDGRPDAGSSPLFEAHPFESLVLPRTAHPVAASVSLMGCRLDDNRRLIDSCRLIGGRLCSSSSNSLSSLGIQYLQLLLVEGQFQNSLRVQCCWVITSLSSVGTSYEMQKARLRLLGSTAVTNTEPVVLGPTK